MTILNRILLSFLAPILLAIAVVIYQIASINNVGGLAKNAYEKPLTSVENARAAMDEFGRANEYLEQCLSMVTSRDIGAQVKTLAERKAQFQQRLAKIPSDTSAITMETDQWFSMATKWVDSAPTKELPSILEMQKLRLRIDSDLSSLVDRSLSDAALQKAQTLDSVSASTTWSSGLTVLFVLASGAFAWVLAQSLSRPIKGVTQSMQRIASGDLAGGHILTSAIREISQMQESLKVFLNNALENRRLVQEQDRTRESEKENRRKDLAEFADLFQSSISNSLSELETAASRLGDISHGMLEIAQSTSKHSQTVQSASGQASSSVEALSRSADEVNHSIVDVVRQAEDSAGQAEVAVREVDQTATMILGLSEESSRIGSVVELINDIASRTNLLALNATIEAARAGEAGKGFAVVANEVKSLANQTAHATEDISKQVRDIQQRINETVAAVGHIGDMIKAISATGASITEAVAAQAQASQDIVQHVVKAMDGANVVSHSIQTVSAEADKTTRSAGEVREATQVVNDRSRQLHEDVKEFLNRIKAG